MSIRLRLLLAASGAVLLALVVPSTLVLWELQRDLAANLDASLRSRAVEIVHQVDIEKAEEDGGLSGVREPGLGQTDAYLQVVTATGKTVQPKGSPARLPVSAADRAVAAGVGPDVLRTVTVEGVRLRMLTIPAGPDIAVQVARPLAEVESTVREVQRLLLFVLVLGVLAAAGLGWVVATSALVPLGRLTRAAERVARTRDLSTRIEVRGRDELARLAASIDSMLEALDRSVTAQRQLVADASHELRTPLTSLRTNVEVLQDVDRLDPAERKRLLDSTVVQVEELSGLVSDLVELAREDVVTAEDPSEDVAFDHLVAAAVERAQRHWPQARFEEHLEPLVVPGDSVRLDRAVANLLDNAGKFSPDGGRVEVTVADGRLVVRDQGPGIPAEDLPHVFDRFFRSPSARQVPGSGLGLAIVRQTAERHGARVSAAAAPGGGTVVELDFGQRPPRDS